MRLRIFLLSLALLLSPRWMKALNSFSRRSRREEYWKKGMQLGLCRVKTHFPSFPSALAASAAEVTMSSGRPARSSFLSRTSLKPLSSARTFSPNFWDSTASSSLTLRSSAFLASSRAAPLRTNPL